MGRLFRDSGIQDDIWGTGCMDQKSFEVHAVEKVEEPAQISADYGQVRLQTPRCA